MFLIHFNSVQSLIKKIIEILCDKQSELPPLREQRLMTTQGQVHRSQINLETFLLSQETHILHNFDCDLYGSLLKVVITGWLRPEQNFDSLESLITAIKNDISNAERLLDDPEFENMKNHEFFTTKVNKVVNQLPTANDSINGSNGHS
jgi:hypothetical protein